jgi:hypothetical protein
MTWYPKQLHCLNCGEYTVEYGPIQPWGERSRWCPDCAEEGLRNLKSKRERLLSELEELDKRIMGSQEDIIRMRELTKQTDKFWRTK